MPEKRFRQTYIKQWREKRGLSLRKLAARIESEPGVELISFSSLGRIERGEQAYTQPIIEGIATALNVSVSMLIEVNPEAEGEIIDLARRIRAEDREKVVKMIRALAS